MPATNSEKRILWAIDPFEEDMDAQQAAAWAVHALNKRENSTVEPIYVIGPPSPDFSLDLSPEFLRDLEKRGRDTLEAILERIEISRLKPFKILPSSSQSLRQQVDTLVKYAHEQGAQMIVVSTHSKRGFERFMLGSFAETLTLHSDVPVFVINPKWNRVTYFEHILFPTDFSDASKEAFDQVIDLAKVLGSEITLFHKTKFDWSPSLEVAFNAYPVYRQVFEEELEERRAALNEWAREAQKHGVRARPEIDFQLTGSIANSIMAQAEKRPGIIAMAGQSGTVATIVLGNVTRSVIRGATDPVWVVHPPRKVKKAAKIA